jgi:Tfp pilus assembly protein PilX
MLSTEVMRYSLAARLYLILCSRSADRGFALPLAIGLGLIMLLATVTTVIKTSQDRGDASSKQATTLAQSIAEVGVARYQSFLAQNPRLATYSDCVGTRDSVGLCPDSSTNASWSNAVAIPGVTSSTEITTAAQTAWQNVDPSDGSKGQFRLISYNFVPTDTTKPNQAPGKGTLVVEGRVNQTTAGAEDLATSTGRLELGLKVEGMGNLSSGLRTYDATNPFPPLPPEGQIVNIPTTGVCTITNELGTKITSSITITPNNCPTASGTYYTYHFRNTMNVYLGSGVSITVDAPGQTIRWYVEGDFKIHHEPSQLIVTPGTKLIVYAHGKVQLEESASVGGAIKNSGTPDSVQIYKYDDPTNTKDDIIAISGGSTFNASIFAPDSTVKETDANDVQGVIWAKNYIPMGGSLIDRSADVDCRTLPSGYCDGGTNEITAISSWQRKSR